MGHFLISGQRQHQLLSCQTADRETPDLFMDRHRLQCLHMSLLLARVAILPQLKNRTKLRCTKLSVIVKILPT